MKHITFLWIGLCILPRLTLWAGGAASTSSNNGQTINTLAGSSYVMVRLAEPTSPAGLTPIRLTNSAYVLLKNRDNKAGYVWQNGQLTALTAPPFDTQSTGAWEALDINERGEVVGFTDLGDNSPYWGSDKAVYWADPLANPNLLRRGTELEDAIPPSQGWKMVDSSRAEYIDNSSVIYGSTSHVHMRILDGAPAGSGDVDMNDGVRWNGAGSNASRLGSGFYWSYGVDPGTILYYKQKTNGGGIITFKYVSTSTSTKRTLDFRKYLIFAGTEQEITSGKYFDPISVNENGQFIGSDVGSKVLKWGQGGEAPQEFGATGTALVITNAQDILTLNPEGVPLIWRRRPDNPEVYQKESVDLGDIADKWTIQAKLMNTDRVLAGLGTKIKDDQNNPISSPSPEPVLLVPAELAVDANRDGIITLASDLNPDPELSDQTSEKKPFFFPINDDDDNPGTTPQADYINTVVDGADDLPDFFPVFLDIKQLITVLPPSASVKYKLKQEDSGLNFVYTSLTRATAFAYQNATAATTGYGPSANQAAANATTQQITAAGVELPAAFLTRIKDQDQGVILVELRWMTAKPLKLVVEKDGTQIAEVAANIATGEIKWESQYADNPVESFKVPSYYSDYTTKPLGWLEGLRYFTDGADKNATFHRTRINVKVKMAGAAGKSVKLKAFDVDDPTPAEWDASPAVIDTNDTNGPVGNDNNTGLDATTGSYNQIFGTFYGPTNQVYSDSIIVTLDSGGEASVGFNLSSKPGANYRVAAQLSDSASGIDVLQVTNSTAGKYVSSDNKPVRGFSGVTSPTLTIWRKLHIEIDSMAAIPTEVSSSQKNYATGVIVAEHSTGGPFVSLDLSESLSDRSRYTEQGSRIEIEGVGTYPNGSFSIFEATAANTVRFYVPGGVPSVVGRKYKIYDDDFEVIPLPLTSIAGPVIDRLKAYYAPTFIEPRPAQNPATSVGFVLNQGVPPLLATSVTWNDAQNTADTSYFWQHLVTFGHQGPASEDMDGDIEQYLGATLKNGIFGRYSAIFTETIRDSEYMNRPRDTNAGTQKRFIDWVAMIVAHEIGHAPGTNSSGSDHAETGIMQTGGTSNVQESFSAKSILRFRSTTTWSQP